MIDFEPFLKRILPRVAGAARPAVHDAIRVAAQEFCTRTRLWREHDVIETIVEYDGIMVAPTDAVIFEIESAVFDGYHLEPTSISWLDANKPGWRGWGEAQPVYITQTEPDTVKLVPAYKGRLDLHVILKPSDEAEYFPDWLADHYSQVIADGALAELLTIPAQEFTNPELAMFYAQRFDNRLNNMSSANLKGQQKARVRTKPFWF